MGICLEKGKHNSGPLFGANMASIFTSLSSFELNYLWLVSAYSEINGVSWIIFALNVYQETHSLFSFLIFQQFLNNYMVVGICYHCRQRPTYLTHSIPWSLMFYWRKCQDINTHTIDQVWLELTGCSTRTIIPGSYPAHFKDVLDFVLHKLSIQSF